MDGPTGRMVDALNLIAAELERQGARCNPLGE
jgi:hypothetical protein